MDHYSVVGLDGLVDLAKSKEAYIFALIGWIESQNKKKTQSEGLSQRISNSDGISSERSKNTEEALVEANALALNKLKLAYPKYATQFSVETQLLKSEINERLKGSCPNNSEVGTNLYKSTKLTKKGEINKATLRNIRPDGGLVFFTSPKTGIRYLLGLSENKTQGTNEKRMAEGKKPQALGNAIERSYKNIREVENFLRDESIHPYVMFASGEDLEEEDSSIRERCTAMMNHSPFNELYVHNILDKSGHPVRRTSFFIGVKDVETMSNIIFQMLDTSMKYYLDKYAGEFDAISK